ncbi:MULTISPECIES: hypothetical protein [unclassified Streptomyces]|uniref:hypothetical protein n=1 Tax=unclassified Streptomyces TaxID=2593676 RepID=UPI00368123CC
MLIDGRGRRYSSYKWIPADDVQIYFPQPEVIREYVNRPDAASGRAESEGKCRNGHERTPENTYVDPNGKRQCRGCRAAANARYKKKAA